MPPDFERSTIGVPWPQTLERDIVRLAFSNKNKTLHTSMRKVADDLFLARTATITTWTESTL